MDFEKTRIARCDSVEITAVGEMPDGTRIQLERRDSAKSKRTKPTMLAAFPESRVNIVGNGEPKYGERFRAVFLFDNAIDAKMAFDRLRHGQAVLRDYVRLMEQPRYEICL